MKARHTLLTLLTAATMAPAASYGQGAAPRAAPPPPADPAGYNLHLANARAAGAEAPGKAVLNLCDIPAPRGAGPPPAPAGPRPAPAKFEPGQAFDNLYFLGLERVSAWAIKTSAGVILIDALNNAKDAEETIVPNMRKLGLDPAQIKYLIITHGHGDHYGGGQYIADHFHPRVIASEADWKVMEGPNPFGNTFPTPPPKRDMVIGDGHKLTLGDTTITLYVTPGHTPGTISIIMPVKDKGQPHVAALWGGTAFNFTPADATFRTYAASAARFAGIAAQAKADVFLSNHGFVDDTPTKLPAVATRKPGAPNPFVVGPQAVKNFLTVVGECALAREAAL